MRLAQTTKYFKESFDMNLNVNKDNELDRDTMAMLTLADVEELRAALAPAPQSGVEGMKAAPTYTNMCPSNPWDQ